MVSARAGARERFAAALADAARLAPLVLVLALLAHLAELALAHPAGVTPAMMLRVGAGAALTDLLAVLRYLPWVLLACLPWLHSRSARVRIGGASLVLALAVLAQCALTQYFLRAGVPLGADLLAYSASDIGQTVAGAHVDGALLLLALLLVAGSCWAVARALHAGAAIATSPRLAAIAALAALAWAGHAVGWEPGRLRSPEYLRDLQANKLAWFTDELLHAALARGVPSPAPGTPVPAAPVRSTDAGTRAGTTGGNGDADDAAARDARYPFLHAEHTPDTLGPLLELDPARPPDVTLIIVEGLGRSFSGPGARLGSFTPFLDQLAARSLSWDNFLATQGRTFGVLPSILGSAPFGEHGFLDLPAPLPPHENLPALLAAQGYATRFYSGTNAAFDNQLAYLQLAGFARISDRGHLDADRPVANEWGYDDDTLLRFVASAQASAPRGPALDVVQTVSMHDPFTVPDEAAWQERVAQRLAQLGIGGERATAVRAQAHIYAAILYTDDALRRYFEAAAASPRHANTIYLITGDHRLPEIPMDERIERYHVPLILYSPRLRQPARIAALSSHFDITPALVALLARRYGWQRPARTSWLGAGLATGASLSDGRAFPMMQTKSELADYISGEWYLGRGQLYRLGYGLATEPSDDRAARARVQARFDAFLAANARFAREQALAPPAPSAATATPAGRPPSLHAPTPIASRDIGIEGVRIEATPGHVIVRYTLANAGGTTSVAVAPLAVLLDAAGHELQEAYGQAVQLQPHERLALHLDFRPALPAPCDCYLAVFASDPSTGARVGRGQYHLPVPVAAAP